jgi:hypothetical protein
MNRMHNSPLIQVLDGLNNNLVNKPIQQQSMPYPNNITAYSGQQQLANANEIPSNVSKDYIYQKERTPKFTEERKKQRNGVAPTSNDHRGSAINAW